MSDDDLIARLREQADWAYADGKINLQSVLLRAADALRALPAAVPPAERLARAADAMAKADAVFGRAIKEGIDWKSSDRAAADAYRELTEALAAYRASEQPEPRPLTIPLTDEARRIMACPRCGVSAQPEPSPLQKPPSSCNEPGVRDSLEPAAPFRHGKCCAEEEPVVFVEEPVDAEAVAMFTKEEPAAPAPCGTCPHGLGIERIEGDHLGASVWMERCPECGGGA